MSGVATAETNGSVEETQAPETKTAHETIAEALLAAQFSMPAVERDQTNPHFDSKFTSLDKLLATVKPVLNRQGIVLVQAPTMDGEGRFVLRTILMHAPSGERLEFDAPLSPAKNDPQGQGSAITYMRRYASAAALAIADQEDDDGNAATQRGAAQQSPPAQPEPTIAPEQADEFAAAFRELELTVGRIGALLGKCGISGLRANSAKAITARLESLTLAEAARLAAEIARLKQDAEAEAPQTGGEEG